MDKRLIKFKDNVLGDVSSRQYLKTPYLVFAVSILLTVGITYFFYQSVDEKDHARFDADVAKISATITGRLNAYTTLLKSSRGFIEANRVVGGKEVNKETFAIFVKSFELNEMFPGVQGVGFIKKIQPTDSQQWTDKMRAEGHKEFSIFPESATNKEMFVLSYLEPLEKDINVRGIGYIVSSDAPRYAAIRKAIISGDPAVSDKVALIEQPRDPNSMTRPGFHLYVPMYRGGVVPPTEEQRLREIDGLVYCPFRAVNFVNEVKKASGVENVAFAIYDREVTQDSLLASSTSSPDAPAQNGQGVSQSFSQSVYNSMRFEDTKESNIGNQKWIVKFDSLPNFHKDSSTGWTLIIFFFGLGISLVLFFITLSQSKAHTNLEIIAEDLARSEKVKDEFISVVSHELRTPLNSIAGGVTILRNQRINDETRGKALDIIDKSLRSQVNLVEDMIVFSDINAGKEYLHLKPVDFSVLLEKMYIQFVSQARAKNITIIKEDNIKDQIVAGDEPKLEKVLQNILSNSVKFTQPGGRIVMNAQTLENGQIEVRIADNGFGIHPQVLPFVFDLFKQGDSSTVRRHGGLGLGLTLSRNIIKLHGGSLEAESDGVDKGSTFIICVPPIEQTK